MFKLRALPRTISAAERDLGNDQAKVRLSALRDLSRFAETDERSRAVMLARKALDDADVEVRAQAALVLADLRASECVDDVLRLLGDVQLRVRQLALVSLGELAPPGHAEVLGRLGAFLTVSEPALRYQALAAWARLAPERLAEVLVERIVDADAEVRGLSLRLAHEHWVDAGKGLPEALLEGAAARLEDSHEGVRLLAAVLLGRARAPQKHRRAIEKILVEAVDRRTGVSEPIDEQDAIELCGELRVQGAARALRRRAFGLWGRSRDPFALQAKVALALLGDEGARASILRGLASRSWHERSVSAHAAASAGLVEALPHVVALRSDPRLDRELIEKAIADLERCAAGAPAAEVP